MLSDFRLLFFFRLLQTGTFAGTAFCCGEASHRTEAKQRLFCLNRAVFLYSKMPTALLTKRIAKKVVILVNRSLRLSQRASPLLLSSLLISHFTLLSLKSQFTFPIFFGFEPLLVAFSSFTELLHLNSLCLSLSNSHFFFFNFVAVVLLFQCPRLPDLQRRCFW